MAFTITCDDCEDEVTVITPQDAVKYVTTHECEDDEDDMDMDDELDDGDDEEDDEDED